MSREIKFRAWDGEKIIYPNINKDFDPFWCGYTKVTTRDVKNGDQYSNEVVEESVSIDYILNPLNGYEVMQYTGLKDRNGKEIYEGDICKVWGNPQLHQRFAYDAEIIWEDFSAGFKFKKILPVQVRWNMGHNSCEVIGNIYENPELIAKPKNEKICK